MTARHSAPALVAFDTATEQMAVAVVGARTVCRNLPGGAAASTNLLPALEDALREAGLTWADIGAVGFGRGPGAFTGLRTSCAVAQGLAFGLACPVLPIDSLQIVAEDAWQTAGGPQAFEVGVAMDARMGEIYAARYRRSGDAWQVLDPPMLTDPASLAAAWGAAPPMTCAGSALRLHGAHLGLTETGGPDREHDRAAALAALVQQAWSQGAAVDPAQALPVYLRDRVALTTREREAARAEAGSNVVAGS